MRLIFPLSLFETSFLPSSTEILKNSSNLTPLLVVPASEDEIALTLRKPRRRRNIRHPSRASRARSGSQLTDSPPESPKAECSPIVIVKGAEGFGFQLKAIRVYIGDTSNYTVHHLVQVCSYIFCYEIKCLRN